MSKPLDLFLFTVDPIFGRTALSAGISAFVVDWEQKGKTQRQVGFDTEINTDTVNDIRIMASQPGFRVVCRINSMGSQIQEEVDSAIEAGATVLILPMVETPREVERYMECVGGRVSAGILVETVVACSRAKEFASLGVDRVYVGLNDLSISRGRNNIFEPFIDGAVDRLRKSFTRFLSESEDSPSSTKARRSRACG